MCFPHRCLTCKFYKFDPGRRHRNSHLRFLDLKLFRRRPPDHVVLIVAHIPPDHLPQQFCLAEQRPRRIHRDLAARGEDKAGGAGLRRQARVHDGVRKDCGTIVIFPEARHKLLVAPAKFQAQELPGDVEGVSRRGVDFEGRGVVEVLVNYRLWQHEDLFFDCLYLSGVKDNEGNRDSRCIRFSVSVSSVSGVLRVVPQPGRRV